MKQSDLECSKLTAEEIDQRSSVSASILIGVVQKYQPSVDIVEAFPGSTIPNFLEVFRIKFALKSTDGT